MDVSFCNIRLYLFPFRHYLVRNDNHLLSVKVKGATVEQVFAEGVRKLVEGNYALVIRQGNIESIYVLRASE